MYFAVEQMQYTRADENHGIARDNENGKPGWKSSVLGINIAPIADAQCNDGAQEQAFISNRIENRAERAPLFVTTRDISIEPVAYGCDQKNRDCGKTLPFKRLAALDALAIIDSHRDEYRNHQDPNHRDFVRSRHNAARVTIKGESLSQGWQAIWPSPPTQISRSRLVDPQLMQATQVASALLGLQTVFGPAAKACLSGAERSCTASRQPVLLATAKQEAKCLFAAQLAAYASTAFQSGFENSRSHRGHGFMPAFTEFLDHLFIERGNVIWLAAGYQPVVHHDFLVDPFCSRVAEVDPDSRPRSHSLASN